MNVGSNSAVIVNRDDVVVVDSHISPESARAMLTEIKSLTDKPVRFVINTHFHGDHTGGNALFHDATIVAHDNVRKRLESGTAMGNGGSVADKQEPYPKEALPVVTFSHDVTLHLNGEDIHALHAPSGHTDGDSIVFFTKSNVVHMGDDFVTYGFPFVDITAGGSVRGMIKALETTIPKLPADVKIIPGPGPVSKLDDVRTYLKMLKDTLAVVEKGVKAGKTLEQLKQEKVLAPWQKYSGQFISTDAFIETIWNDLKGVHNGGPAVRHN
jgi:glyoxylase-like metal-dependent hydrolase (beta-lactamase superfamily II)